MYSKHFSHSNRLVLFAAACSGLVSAGCVGESPGNTHENPDAKTLVEDTRYMSRTLQDRVLQSPLGFVKLDLADDGQYAFVKHRLLASGNTPENSPRLFELVETTRRLAVSRFKAEDGVGSINQALDVEGDWCGQFMNTPFKLVSGQSQLDATAYVTCFDGASYVFGAETAYETNEAETYYNYLTSTSAEEYAGGTNFDAVNVTPMLPINVGKYHFVDSLVIASDDVNQRTHMSYAMAKILSADREPSIALKHPVQNPETSTVDIRNCILRSSFGGTSDCDYAGVNAQGIPGTGTIVGVARMTKVSGSWTADQNPSNRWYPTSGFALSKTYLPLAGTFDAGISNGVICDIKDYDQVNTRAIMMRNTTGGWCAADPVSGSLYTAISKAPTSGPTDAFNVLGDFGANCLSHLQPVTVKITVAANTACGPRSADAPLAKTDYRTSCFAKGTGVLRADGKYIAIESLEIGAKLAADESGHALTVTSLARGPELHPLVRIVDSRGHDILVTEKHPIITTAGILQAEKITEGTEVRTETGLARVVLVERAAYDGEVYNVSVGTAEELARIAPTDRTLFASGFLVGDNRMQQDLEQQSLEKSHVVSAAWQGDYLKDKARGARVILPN